MDHTDLPRWRGFNIQNKFVGFDFVRVPMDYQCWTGGGWWRIDEDARAAVPGRARRAAELRPNERTGPVHSAPAHTWSGT